MHVMGFVAGGVAVAAAASVATGALAWSRATAHLVTRLHARTLPRPDGAAAPDRFSLEELAGLPAPVVRYFDLVLTPGQRLIRRARLTQRGTFALEPGRWSPFTATEDFSVGPPGFVWDARIRMAPLVAVRVRDSYVEGEGVMRAAIASLYTVVDQRGTPEMAAGALLRYLAESAWVPTALLPGAGVRWSAVDDITARASLTDAGTTVSMDVHFGARGEIVRISALRHRDVDGTPVLTPWVGHFADYARVEDMMVPMTSEVGWVTSAGWQPYWRGRTVHSAFERRGSRAEP